MYIVHCTMYSVQCIVTLLRYSYIFLINLYIVILILFICISIYLYSFTYIIRIIKNNTFVIKFILITIPFIMVYIRIT